MKTIKAIDTMKLSLISLLAIVGFVQPTQAQVIPKTTASKVAATYRKITIAQGYTVAYLYTTHSANSPILKTFRGGEKVKELETKGNMMKVTFGNQKGWIRLR